MSRARFDVGGGGAPAAAKGGASARAEAAAAKRKKLIISAAIGALALAVIGYQVVPMLLERRPGSGNDSTSATGTDPSTEVPADTSDLAPGQVVPPVQVKPRGAGKRPVGPG